MRQRINKKMNTFTVKTAEGAKKPSIYIDEDGNTEVTCDDITDNSMLCHISSSVLTETKDYEVYYKGVCDIIRSTGITLENAIAVDVAVNSITIINSANEICSREPIKAIKLVTNSTEPKEVDSVVISNEDSEVTYTKCVTIEDSVTCSSEAAMENGNYKVKEVNGVENNFIITSVESTVISYEVDYISSDTEVTHVINNEKKVFELQLTKQTSEVAIYVESKEKRLPCSQKDNLIFECTPDDSVMPVSRTYELFYIPSCMDTLATTNIKVDYSVTITTTGLALPDIKICSKEEITSITVTTDKIPTQDVTSAVIVHTDGSQFTFTKCSYSETTVTCTDLSTELKRGEYKLLSLSGKDTFITSALESTIKFDPEMIAEETKTDPIVDRENESFTIVLTEDNLNAPTFYVGNSQDKELQCEQNGKEVLCSTNDDIMPVNDKYEIYYTGSCGELTKSNIVVTREKVFVVTNMTLSDEKLCAISPITSVILTLDAKPTSSIVSATLTNGIDNYKFTSCTDDEETHMSITCTTPDKELIAGKYTLVALEGPDTYTFSQEVFVKYEVDPLGTQSTTQTIDNDTKVFTVKLASEDTEQPVIYIDEAMPKEFTCSKEGHTLTCEYNETLMPENGEYEILYEGACRIPGTTNIKVTRLLPVTVTSVAIGENDAVCTGEGIKEIIITTDIKPFTSVNSIILTDESTDYSIGNCSMNENTVICSTPVSQMEYGVYKIKEVDAEEAYDVDTNNMRDIELKYEEDPLGELEDNSNFVIDNETVSFTIKGENIKALPHIYAGNDLTREIVCSFEENETTVITCTPDDVNMNENKIYEIYYEGSCGVLKNTGITVENTNAKSDEEGKDPELIIITKGYYLSVKNVVLILLSILLL